MNNVPFIESAVAVLLAGRLEVRQEVCSLGVWGRGGGLKGGLLGWNGGIGQWWIRFSIESL